MTPKERVELSIIGIGLLLLVFILPSSIQQVKKRMELQKKAAAAGEALPAAPEVPPEIPPAPVMLLEPLDEAQRERQRAVLKEPWGRDPFQHKATAPSPVRTELVLKGVALLEDGRAMALINETIVQQGDTLEGHLIKRIEPAQVVLQRDGREFILKLQEEEEKDLQREGGSGR